MSLEIGPTPPVRPASATPKAPSSASFQATLAGATPAVTVDIGIPAVPPDEVRAAVGAAADRADALAAENRELHFERDEVSGRVVVQVRDLATGEVIRTIPPSHALEVLSGGAL